MYPYSKYFCSAGSRFDRHFLRPLALVFLLSPLMACAQQDSADERFNSAEVQAISESLEVKLEPARNCLAPHIEAIPEAEPAPECALEVLDSIDRQGLPSHELAEIWNLYGYAHFLLEDSEKSVEYYERIINEPDANAPLRNRTLKTVAQLNMILERFEPALDYYQQWLDEQEEVGADEYALLSMIYYNLDQQEASLEYIEKAIDMNETQGQLGKENWYSMQRSIYYNRQDCARALNIVRKLQDAYPGERYIREIKGLEKAVEEGCHPGDSSA